MHQSTLGIILITHGADRKGVNFIGNKETNKRTYIQTFNFIY